MLRYRPRLLHLHDGVGWGGVGWADNVQWHLQTYVMLRYRPRLLHLQTYVMLRYRLALAHIGDATLPTSSLALADIRDGSKVSVRTGGIDQAWKDLKKNVPNSIATRKDGAPNPLLWQYATQWQWRWENSACANLSRLTAETLRANMQ